MNEFYVVTGWALRLLQLMVVVYLLYYFKQHRFSLFFGGSASLKTPEDHKLHSCFLTAVACLTFYIISSQVADFILLSEMERLAKIKIYYFTLVCTGTAFAATLYLLHIIRGCQFFPAARYSIYLVLFLVLLNAAQLMLRGYFNNDLLFEVYGPATVVTNLLEWLIVIKYPFYKFMESRIRQEA
ncbi:hypothetical protein [Pseudoalteromonas rubra]|uniref:hypothetical protein n=1 Tax=Pseudoalteromonas rubra TaxID=43658 RepID=UPI000F771D18|nr:hypothetical protein [Pseudoalteromonas rubra]